jgi:hypothetical protein
MCSATTAGVFECSRRCYLGSPSAIRMARARRMVRDVEAEVKVCEDGITARPIESDNELAIREKVIQQPISERTDGGTNKVQTKGGRLTW